MILYQIFWGTNQKVKINFLGSFPAIRYNLPHLPLKAQRKFPTIIGAIFQPITFRKKLCPLQKTLQ